MLRPIGKRSAVVSLVIIVGFLIPVVLAVHDTGVFELDGNAITEISHDWDQVCFQATGDVRCGTTTPAGATSVSWTGDILQGGTDAFANDPNATIFTGGGSKDPQDISQWAWKDGAGGLPDKDNLNHSFAARYSLPPSATCPSSGATCELLYFGSDRFDNSGDAQQGFWFFQNQVGLGTNSVGGGKGFTGVHRPGDLLIISDFSNGGTTSTISVFIWDPTCTATNKPTSACADANLRTLATSNAANCSTAGPNDAFCGLVDPVDGTPAPWPFLDKRGSASFAQGELYEGGINLSLLPGGVANECFASVGSETRSSTSTTATLKDFVLSTFGNCTSGLTTTPRDGSGNPIPPGGLSIGTGSVSVRDHAQVVVTGAQTWSGTLKFFLCGPADLTNGVCAPGTGTAIGNPIPVSNPSPANVDSAAATITSVGNYCWRGEFTSTTNGVPNSTDASAGECFAVNPVTPAIPTAASGNVQLGSPVSDIANLSGTASQPGSPVVNGPLGAPAGGTITFRLYGPNDATCSTAPVFTSPPVNVSGDALYSSGNFTPTAVGTYRWIATYTGNAPNTLGITGVCNAANESVVVNATPAISTAQTFTVKDSATITVPAGAGNLSGSVRFQLFNNAACDPGSGNVNVLYDSNTLHPSGFPVSGASPQTVTSDTTTVTGPTLSWLVVYTNTAPNQAGATSTCNTEGATLSIHQ